MKKCDRCGVVGRILFPYKHGSLTRYLCWSCRRGKR